MHFLVVAYDYTDADTGPRRIGARPAHTEGLNAISTKGQIVAAAAILDDTGANTVGSMFVLEMPGRAEVDEWVAQEPYNQARVWERVEVRQLKGLRQ